MMKEEDNINEPAGWRRGVAELEALETYRRQTEEGFNKVQKQFIYNSSKDAIAYITPEGILIIDVNDSFLRLTGYLREELLRKRYQDITPKEYHEYESKMVEKILRTGEAVEYEKEYIRKDDSLVPISQTVLMVKGTGSKPLCLAAIIKDLTDRRILHEKSQRQAEELNRRNKDLEILNTITQAVHQSLELEEVYKVALDMTTALENIDMAMIYLVDDDRKEAILQAYRNVPEDYIRRAERIPYPKGITWNVINTGEIVNVEDAQKHPDIGPAGRDLGHHGILGIPITLEGRVIGVIWFISYKERQFNKQEIDLLTSIGNQIAIAIAKAKLYRELYKKNRYETIIRTVTQSVHQSIDLQDVLENAVEALSKNIDGVNIVSIYKVEGEEAFLRAHRGLPDGFTERAGRIPYPTGATWKTIIDGKPIHCPDVDKDTVIGSAGRDMGIKSYLCMPISYEGKAVGIININSLQKNAFDEEELKLLEIVAQQVEVALHNAQRAEALRQSEEKYRTLFEQSPVGVYIFDKQLKVTKCNKRMVEILQSSYDKIIGLDIRELKDQSFAPAMEKVLEGQTSYHEDFYEATTSPAKLWLSVCFSPLCDVNRDVIGGMAVAEDITERKLAEEQLQSSREQLRTLAAHLQSVREEERARIAREIHDELSQTLTGLQMSLSWLSKKLSKADDEVALRSLLLQEIKTMSKLIDNTAQAVQEISTELRPLVLDDFGLIPAIEWQAQEFQTRMGIRCRFISTLENITLDKDRSTAIFRILQETLTNVARHAKATIVDISLRKETDNLILEVKDNGKGITESEISNPRSLGLLGMKERALLLGGDVRISGTRGKGTVVTVQIPY